VLRSARGPNSQVARHRLTLTEVWQLPIGDMLPPIARPRPAYAVQPVNTPGNAKPVSAWGPGFWTTDLSLVKRFAFNTFTADLRAEAFNLFNTVNYGQPNGTFGSAAFGQITSAGDPRIVQLAVRIGF
jgi:hypothetical protein